MSLPIYAFVGLHDCLIKEISEEHIGNIQNIRLILK